MKKRTLFGLGVAASVTGALVIPASSPAAVPAIAPQHTTITVVARGLANPRGVTVVPGFAAHSMPGFPGAVRPGFAPLILLVAEAGKGGSGPCITNDEGQQCFGTSSALTEIAFGSQRRIVKNLPSLSDPGGANAVGLDNIAITPTGLVGVIGLGNNPSTRATFGAKGKLLASLVNLRPGGTTTSIADLGAYEKAHNPDAGDPGSSVDTDPYDVIATPQGLLVADAGGNDVLSVSRSGHVSTAAVLHARLVDAPPFLGLPAGTKIPMQAVPTSLASAAGGKYYLGQLTGFPFPVGGANVYKFAPGHTPTVYASGFTNVVDVAADRWGNVYVLELTKAGLLSSSQVGALIKIAPNGHRTEIAPGRLKSPGGMAIAADGSIYVSVNSISPTSGQVVRIQP
jgi:hypothetical protein